ncbi:MAG: hypothetical protein ABIF82_09025 [Planctomycetota bacterium]
MFVRTLAIALLALAAGGCAFSNRANTPLLTALDGAVEPKSTGAKVALAPVFIPAGMACGALDIALLHPLQSLWFAAEDTWSSVWAAPSGSFVQQAALFVPKAAASPVVYAFCWVGETLFDLRPQKTKEPE